MHNRMQSGARANRTNHYFPFCRSILNGDVRIFTYTHPRPDQTLHILKEVQFARKIVTRGNNKKKQETTARMSAPPVFVNGEHGVDGAAA